MRSTVQSGLGSHHGASCRLCRPTRRRKLSFQVFLLEVVPEATVRARRYTDRQTDHPVRPVIPFMKALALTRRCGHTRLIYIASCP